LARKPSLEGHPALGVPGAIWSLTTTIQTDSQPADSQPARQAAPQAEPNKDLLKSLRSALGVSG